MADGKAVRLTQGEAGSETDYGDPVEAALEWARQGADWIHLVDLDAAFGRGSNAGVLRKVQNAFLQGLSVQEWEQLKSLLRRILDNGLALQGHPEGKQQ